MKPAFRFIALAAIAFFASHTSQAQRFDVKWGDNARLKYDFEDAVPLNNGQFILLKLKAGARKLFSNDIAVQPILVLVDKNMENISEVEIAIDEKSATLKGL
ncbi:MAG: hypothetical protein EOO13_16055, partial [Chitinophagaceae bacterium]